METTFVFNCACQKNFPVIPVYARAGVFGAFGHRGVSHPAFSFLSLFSFFVSDSSTSASDQTFPPSSPYVASQLITQEKLAEDAA